MTTAHDTTFYGITLSREARVLLAAEQRAPFYALLKRANLPLPEPEYRFDPTRKWRFDFAFVDAKVGLEVDGAVFKTGGGRHTRGAGWLKDTEKLNTAACLGWRMLRCTPSGLCTHRMLDTIAFALTYSTP